jgi:hypothetical protein
MSEVLSPQTSTITKLDIATLLKLGFLPKELPPPFTSCDFAEYIEVSGPIDPAPTHGRKGLITRPAVHNLARPGGERRPLHLPNPFSYYILSVLLEQGWSRLQKHFQKSRYSTSAPISDPSGSRALKRQLEGRELAFRRAEVRGGARYVLRTDISRFYGSIYTHSIPWALDGKTTAKKSREGGLANNLDKALRNLQDGQTLGIPVGPDASLVIAEIVACSVDRELQAKGLTGMRFMDDYEIGFLSRSEAEAGLAVVEEVLSDFELAINPRKTSILRLPIELDRKWVAEIQTYQFKEAPATSFELVEYFNRVFELKSLYPSDAVISYAVARLRSVEVGDLELLQNLICQCALAEPGAMEPVVTLMQEKVEGQFSDALDRLIASIISFHAPLSHGSEVAWALWAALWFEQSIPSSVAKSLKGNRDPVVAVLSLHAKERGLIKKDVSFADWFTIDEMSLYNSQWLLAYEGDRRGWFPSSKSKFVDADPNFCSLKSADVSFFDPELVAPTKSLLWQAEMGDIYE